MCITFHHQYLLPLLVLLAQKCYRSHLLLEYYLLLHKNKHCIELRFIPDHSNLVLCRVFSISHLSHLPLLLIVSLVLRK
jgi:hypothetical protein